MDILNKSMKECFEYCFDGSDSLKQNDSVFSCFLSSQPQGYQYYYPLHLSWKLTSACNLRCKHCFYYSEQEKFFDNSNDLTFSEAMDIAKFMVEDVNIISVTLTGGEALLCPYFEDILAYFKSKNVCTTILTNGILITPKIAELFSKLLNFKYDSIQISLDGATADVHDSIRGQGAFDRACEGIENLNKFDIPIRISAAVTSKNISRLTDYAELCNKYKINELALNRYKVLSPEQSYLAVDIETLFVEYAKLLKLLKGTKLNKNIFYAYDFLNFDYGRELFDTIQLPVTYNKNKVCHNHSRIHMTADGKIYLCPSAECSDLCLGDLRTQNFDEIWQSRFSNPLFQSRHVDDMSCSSCKYVSLCRCGCPFLSFYNSGNICAKPVDCHI